MLMSNLKIQTINKIEENLDQNRPQGKLITILYEKGIKQWKQDFPFSQENMNELEDVLLCTPISFMQIYSMVAENDWYSSTVRDILDDWKNLDTKQLNNIFCFASILKTIRFIDTTLSFNTKKGVNFVANTLLKNEDTIIKRDFSLTAPFTLDQVNTVLQSDFIQNGAIILIMAKFVNNEGGHDFILAKKENFYLFFDPNSKAGFSIFFDTKNLAIEICKTASNTKQHEFLLCFDGFSKKEILCQYPNVCGFLEQIKPTVVTKAINDDVPFYSGLNIAARHNSPDSVIYFLNHMNEMMEAYEKFGYACFTHEIFQTFISSAQNSNHQIIQLLLDRIDPSVILDLCNKNEFFIKHINNLNPEIANKIIAYRDTKQSQFPTYK